MSKHLFVRSAVAFAAIGFLVVATAAPVVFGAEPVGKSAQLECFSHPDRINYFALSLKPSAATEATVPHDVVLLIDTSASQTGDYRSDAIGTLQGVLSNLSPNDRVKLIAVDLNAVPLTEGFVAPGSSETAAALKKLDARVPLGATDMEQALTAAADSFKSGSQNARAAIYIGDGMSTACLLGTEKFEKLTKRLLDARIPISSSPVGPRVDMQLLGALAMNTGGLVIPMGNNAAGELAATAAGTVLWPEANVSWPSGFEVYPTRMPPLRGDRDSVVIGTYKGKGPFEIKMTVGGPNGTENLSWTVPGGTSNEDNNYLVELVDRAKVDGGVSLPLVGSASLAHARDAVNAGVDQLSRLSRQALASGNLDNAQRLAGEALNRDPHNPEALAIQGAVAKKRRGDAGAQPSVAAGNQAVAGNTASGDLDIRGDAPGIPADAGGFAEAFSHQRKVIAQVIQAQVINTVNQARQQMGTDPQGATQNLKLTLEMVRQAPDINPEVRDQLVDVIQAALLAASRRKVEVDQQRRQTQENLARAKERILINEGLLHKQEKVRQLMERFDSLMDEGRYNFAEEAAAAEAHKADPDNPVPLLAMKYSRMKGHAEKMLEYRLARQKGYIDALASVENSSIPTSDEPPIVYSDAGVWQELSARRKEKYSSMDLASQGTAEKKIDDALRSPTQLEFLETPLQDAIDYLKDYHQIEIQMDSKALDDAGVRTDTPITKNLKGISLRSALRLTLREMDLTYVIKDEVLLITTPEVVDTMLTTKVYPVADLVLPIEDSGFTGGFGGLGGQSGGMGGMGGGGMGGGGMGGGGGMMGGGMGGMGGGGGGMFNIPVEIFPETPVEGFRAFAVEDDLSKENANATADKVENIKLIVPEGVDQETAWNEYFATHDPTPTAVRDAVRRLMKDRKFDRVIALIQAALRHRQVQPWMYEVMILAMEAEGRGNDEIERVAMSAVDFANNSADLMHIGVYLDRLGLHHRALKIYRQVAKLEPVWAEPYVHGLKTSRKIDDIDGIRWSTLGILSQAWTAEQADVWKLGLFVANDTLKKLRADKQTTQEAKRFEAALNEAIQRDCVAVVSWTGNADIDLMVEEPSGTICSLRNRRTNAGGVLLGDGCSRLRAEPAEGYREVYVCPKGFDGTYRLLVRRVWGKVTAGKVTVEVITHFRSKNASRIRRKVSLNNDEALVAFDLTDGRRKETLDEHQLANAARAQIAVGRQILAQQLAAAADPEALQSLAMSRSDGSESIPFFRGGAVGYQPVIITLPEGTNLAATAVISADRRYVRITCVPLFSLISDVNVFNMVTGENAAGQGGTGGQGYSG